MPEKSPTHAAGQVLFGHLQRVEYHLLLAGRSRKERDEILLQIRDQFEDLLPSGDPNALSPADIQTVFKQLTPPDGWIEGEPPRSLRERLCAWNRFLTLPVYPLLIQDQGKRRLLLGPLLLYTLALGFPVLAGLLLVYAGMRGRWPTSDSLVPLAMMLPGALGGILWSIHRIAIPTLPTAEHVPPMPWRLVVRTFTLAWLSPIVLILPAGLITYGVVAIIRSQPPWHYSPDIFVPALFILGALCLIVTLLGFRHQRRTRRRLEALISA